MGQGDDVGCLDAVDAQDLVGRFSRDGVVDVEHHDRLAAPLVPRHLHPRDVDGVIAQNHADAPNDTRPVAVMCDQQITDQRPLQREAVDLQDARIDAIPTNRDAVRIAAVYLESELGRALGVGIGPNVGDGDGALACYQPRVDRRTRRSVQWASASLRAAPVTCSTTSVATRPRVMTRT